MAAPPLPVEWIRGRPKGEWIAGGFGVILASAIPASLVYAWLVPFGTVSAFANSILTGLVVGLSIFFGLTVYNEFFPMPLAGLGVSPGGVIAAYGLRTESFPWSRAFLTGDQLLLVSGRFGFVTRYRLTAYQAARVGYLRPSAF